MRSSVPLSAVIRVLEFKLLPKRNSTKESGVDPAAEIPLSWNKQQAFSNHAYADFVLDDNATYMVVPTNGKSRRSNSNDCDHSLDSEDGEENKLLPPSILPNVCKEEDCEVKEARRETVTTNDFLQPNSLLNSNKDKIYGFYYLVS